MSDRGGVGPRASAERSGSFGTAVGVFEVTGARARSASEVRERRHKLAEEPRSVPRAVLGERPRDH
jgi:hypothetical protein